VAEGSQISSLFLFLFLVVKPFHVYEFHHYIIMVRSSVIFCRVTYYFVFVFFLLLFRHILCVKGFLNIFIFCLLKKTLVDFLNYVFSQKIESFEPTILQIEPNTSNLKYFLFFSPIPFKILEPIRPFKDFR